MAKPTPKALEKSIDALQADYELWQADEEGERELDTLRPLVGRGKRLLRKSRKLKSGRGREVASRIEALLTDLRMSRDALTGDDRDGDGEGFDEGAFEAITERLLEGEEIDLDGLGGELGALGGARDEPLVTALGQRAGFLLARYNRHFGGQPRTTRDLALLEDLHGQLTGLMERLSEQMLSTLDEELMDRLELLAEQAELWASESQAIDEARGALRGRPWAEALGAVAREQIAQWSVQVEGNAPLTVRPKLAARLIGTLSFVRSGLGKMADHALSEDVDLPGELEQLDALIARWRSTQGALKAARKASTKEARHQALELAAGDLILRWAGEVEARAPGERELSLVGGFCDRLYELERQLSNLDEADEAHARFLTFVRDQLHHWELAWEALNDQATGSQGAEGEEEGDLPPQGAASGGEA